MFIRCVTSQWFGVTSWVCSLRGLYLLTRAVSAPQTPCPLTVHSLGDVHSRMHFLQDIFNTLLDGRMLLFPLVYPEDFPHLLDHPQDNPHQALDIPCPFREEEGVPLVQVGDESFQGAGAVWGWGPVLAVEVLQLIVTAVPENLEFEEKKL